MFATQLTDRHFDFGTGNCRRGIVIWLSNWVTSLIQWNEYKFAVDGEIYWRIHFKFKLLKLFFNELMPDKP